MTKPDVINGYKLQGEFVLAGMGEWTFAQKDGVDYFIKRFLHPTYPLEGSPGSETLKAQKRKLCAEFEARNERLHSVLREKVGTGGNLIIPHDFFRDGSRYYKVTIKVDISGIGPAELSKIPLADRLLVMTTVAHSLRILHRAGIVHGDIKPENILISRSDTSDFIAKLIDFDDSYFNSEPPIPEETVGDQRYYSPELMEYLVESGKVAPSDLQTASDIFALGLVFCQYITGHMPDFDTDKYAYAHLAVIHGETLQLKGADLPSDLIDTINQMLLLDYRKRPNIDTVFNQLRDTRFVLMGKLPASSKGKSTTPPPPSTGTLKMGRGFMSLPVTTDTTPTTSEVEVKPEEPPKTKSRLKINSSLSDDTTK